MRLTPFRFFGTLFQSPSNIHFLLSFVHARRGAPLEKRALGTRCGLCESDVRHGRVPYHAEAVLGPGTPFARPLASLRHEQPLPATRAARSIRRLGLPEVRMMSTATNRGVRTAVPTDEELVLLTRAMVLRRRPLSRPCSTATAASMRRYAAWWVRVHLRDLPGAEPEDAAQEALRLRPGRGGLPGRPAGSARPRPLPRFSRRVTRGRLPQLGAGCCGRSGGWTALGTPPGSWTTEPPGGRAARPRGDRATRRRWPSGPRRGADWKRCWRS